MLIHIVCWKYKEETIPETREEHRERLRGLKDVIPEVIELNVGEDILHLERSYDTGLVATFNDQAGLDAYTVHPEHQTVAAMGKQIAAHVVSVDFLN